MKIHPRALVMTASAAAALSLAPCPIRAAPPTPTAVTPALVAAAQAEGRVVFYTAIDIVVAEQIAKSFHAAYPGITVQVERNGGERIAQRIAQERGSNIYAVDVLDSSDTAQFITWKNLGWLTPFVPAEAATWPADQRDTDGYFANERFTLMPIAYNSRLVKPADAPRSFADLLDAKWRGKIVKAHPGYSGGIVTSTFQTSQALGWSYFEKLGQQQVMQVQSATEPPKKLAMGERAIEADGLEYVLVHMKENGDPVEIVYPTEGTPLITGSVALADKAPHPNAARLFISYLFSHETQQFMSDIGGMRSFRPDVTLKAGRKPLGEIKLMKSDPAAQERDTEALKQKYAAYFGT
jgi:iron(III) transport system substrate-binding protein